MKMKSGRISSKLRNKKGNQVSKTNSSSFGDLSKFIIPHSIPLTDIKQEVKKLPNKIKFK